VGLCIDPLIRENMDVHSVFLLKTHQIPDCESSAKHKCGGVFCSANGWVCAEHWVEENIGYSQKGYVCINCWHEVGSGGH